MTHAQIDALPDELRAIVLYDREMAAIRAADIPSFERFVLVKDVRADWRKAALARWSGSVRGEGPGRRA